MKKLTVFFMTLFAAASVAAQDAAQTYLWPIEGAKAGEGIIYTPQSYIDSELNYDNLFVTAPEGTTVLAPCDGIISSFSTGYNRNLSYSISYNYGEDLSFADALREIRAGLDKSIDPKYVTGHMGISTNDGTIIWLYGLTGDQVFKTGQKVKRGEPIGRVDYSYHKITEPSISLSISRRGNSVDPMSPFGLKSTFVALEEIKPITSLTREQVKEDFLIYIDILKEAYPGLYNVVTEQELEEYVKSTVASIDSGEGDMPYADFWYIINGAVAKIHDSHIYLRPPVWRDQNKMPDFQPAVWYGFIGGKFIVTIATKEYEGLIGREVASLNGIPADSVLNIIHSQTSGYDAKVEAFKEYRAATQGFVTLFKDIPTWDAEVEFADGEKMNIKGVSTSKGMPKYVNNMSDFSRINWHPERTEMKMMNDSTAYIGLSSFILTQVQVEEVRDFIDSIAAVPHLIIDVRNNGGGHVNVLNKIYSYIAGEPMHLDGYSKVNKRGNFAAAEYSINYQGVTNEIFPDFMPEEGKDGFYLRSEADNIIMPDSTVNYKGKVYVLTNEISASAATVFPALLVRNHRGVVVGRETQTAYHFMNALKFMQIRLPNSQAPINIPLVEIYFDTAVNERVPFGRGVIPDYEVPLTLEEMTYKDGDVILNYTLKLIEDGEYIKGDDPFVKPQDEAAPGKYKNLLIIGGIVIIVAVVIILLLSRKRKKNR